jgi:oligopeptide/dipeptide ABC transporter ATP-binding protein
MSAAIVVEGLQKRFKRRGQPDVVAADDVSFEVPRGSTLGLVGESGSGKSTVARCLLGLLPADGGRIELAGRDIRNARPKELREWRRDMQIVFQEPFESLDPRLKIIDAVAEPLIIHTDLRGEKLRRRVMELLELVQLRPDHAERLPHQLSGGEQQRVNIARALATDPEIVVLDEPTSSLDVSVRAEILKLLVRLQRELDLTYVLISHDLPTVRGVCDRVAVMYLGRIVEVGPADVVLATPAHPYTEFLLGSELSLDPDVKPRTPAVKGEARLSDEPAGCLFARRCPVSVAACEERQPPLAATGQEGHDAACIFARQQRQVEKVTHAQ